MIDPDLLIGPLRAVLYAAAFYIAVKALAHFVDMFRDKS